MVAMNLSRDYYVAQYTKQYVVTMYVCIICDTYDL